MLALANTGERFGYYTMLAILLLFLQAKFAFSTTTAGLIYSTFLALVYFMPMIGGWIADKWNFQKTVTLGIIVMFLGYLVMAIPTERGATMSLVIMLTALLLISCGTGLFKGNLQVMVGDLYNDPRYSDKRDVAFSLFYMAINIGAMFAPSVTEKLCNVALNAKGLTYNPAIPSICNSILAGEATPEAESTLREFAGNATDLTAYAANYMDTISVGYSYAFAVACASMVVSFIIYKLGARTYNGVSDSKAKTAGNASAAPVKELTSAQTKSRITALLLVFAVVIFFWMVFHQNGATLTKFAEVFTASEGSGWTRISFNVWALATIVVGVYSAFNLFQSKSAMSRLISGVLLVAVACGLWYFYSETPNPVTGKTKACFEPTIDYCVLKIPRLPFDKFTTASRTLGTQMKATGEVMAIANSFEGAVMKAIRSLELNVRALKLDKLEGLYTDEIEELLVNVTDERLFVVAEALRRGFSPQKIYSITKMDIWFLDGFKRIIDMEEELKRCKGEPDIDTLKRAKEMCFADSYIGALCGMTQADVKALRERYGIIPAFKMVDTCAAEFDAETPYYYSTYDGENEARDDGSGRKKVLVLGSGPIRIGQGIEFDYCSVHSVWALRKLGCETIIVNNNPETVSTDFDVADKLYFEPLTAEDVQNIVEQEKPWGAVVQFGGQTAIKLTEALMKMGVPILGTSAQNVDAAEDRELFDKILEETGIPRAAGGTVYTAEEAKTVANRLGYPVLVRPSYVLGGQGMQIALSDGEIEEFMAIINRIAQDHPILVDKYLQGKEIEVDAVCDGTDILIPGIMEHIERTGVHSGDSISVYPAHTIGKLVKDKIAEYTRRLARALHVKGLINIQFIAIGEDVYVIEVNPRSSRTVPYISKVTGIPIVDLATEVILGRTIRELGYEPGLQPEAQYYAIKMPVFSFEKIRGAEISLGPEMKSTGECLGIAKEFHEALYKAFLGAGVNLPRHKNMIITVKDADKGEAIEIGRRFAKLGYTIYATRSTAAALIEAGVKARKVNKISQESPTVMDLILGHRIDLVIDTPTQGRDKSRDGFLIRRNAIETGVNCLTSLDTARALVTSLENAGQGLTLVDVARL